MAIVLITFKIASVDAVILETHSTRRGTFAEKLRVYNSFRGMFITLSRIVTHAHH